MTSKQITNLPLVCGAGRSTERQPESCGQRAASRVDLHRKLDRVGSPQDRRGRHIDSPRPRFGPCRQRCLCVDMLLSRVSSLALNCMVSSWRWSARVACAASVKLLGTSLLCSGVRSALRRLPQPRRRLLLRPRRSQRRSPPEGGPHRPRPRSPADRPHRHPDTAGQCVVSGAELRAVAMLEKKFAAGPDDRSWRNASGESAVCARSAFARDGLLAKVVAAQRFLTCSKASVDEVRDTLACLAARFSFRDLPDFLVILCRGDLSDIARPLMWGAWLVPIP